MSARAGSAGKKTYGQVVDQVAGQGHEKAGAESGPQWCGRSRRGHEAREGGERAGLFDAFYQDEEPGNQRQNAPGNVPEKLRGGRALDQADQKTGANTGEERGQAELPVQARANKK